MSTDTSSGTVLDVRLPELGESVTEATITQWLVAVGDRVVRDQLILEVATDKVDAEIPSPATGTVVEILAQVDDDVTTDTVILRIAIGEEVAGGNESSRETPARKTESDEPARIDQQEAQTTPPARPAAVTASSPGTPTRRVFATPLARKVAAAAGVDLNSVTGSGSQGRITRTDVLRVADGDSAKPQGPAEPSSSRQTATSTPPEAGRDQQAVTIEKMSRIRRITAEHLHHSLTTAVHVTTVFHADLTRAVAARQRVRDRFQQEHGTKLTFMPFIFRALTRALAKHRQFNASIVDDEIHYKRDIHLGMAVNTDHGLLVPVIHHADQLDLVGLAQRANDLAQRARDRQLKPDDIQGGTFTVTNPGVYGSLFGTPIIHHPQVSILCLGTIEKRAVVVTDSEGVDSIAIRTMAYFALTYDHRLIDGADAEIFMRDVLDDLEGGDWPEIEGA